MKKLAVGFPWFSPFMWTEAVDSYLAMQHPPGYEVKWFRGDGWCSAYRHISLLEKAMDWEADLFCFVDADQVHPPDMLPKLVSRITNDNCGAISALVPSRDYPTDERNLLKYKSFQRLAWKKDTKGRYAVVEPNEGDLLAVDVIGTGVLMFPCSALDRIKRPWFFETITHSKTYTNGQNEDTEFVRRLKAEAKLQVWVDTTIDVRHLDVFQVSKSWQDLELPK